MNEKFEMNLKDVLASFRLDSINVPDYMIDNLRSRNKCCKVYTKTKGIGVNEDKRRDSKRN